MPGETSTPHRWRHPVSMDLRLSQRPTLLQRMTPQLALLMGLLARPWHELRQELTAAITDNPALEEVPEAEDSTPAEEEGEPVGPVVAAPAADSDEARFLEYLAGGSGADLVRVGLEPEAADDDRMVPERAPVVTIGLAE